ncbi:MAG: PAS domain S-box protein [Bryobacteraceae bacterium]
MTAMESGRRPASDAFLPILDELPTMIWRSRADGACDYFNRSWLEFRGRSLEQELGDGWSEGVHPDDRERVLAAWRQTVATQSSFEMEYRLRRHDGAYRWILDIGKPLFGADGTLTGHIGNCVDLTERKQAEGAARRYEVLSEQARDALLLVGAEAEILEVNRAAEKMYGYTREELHRLTIRDLRAPQSQAGLPGQLRQAWREGILLETVHRRKDGTEFAVEVSAQAAALGDRRVLVSIIRDISDRYRIQERLRASESQYRSLFENMHEGVVIHELVYGQDGSPSDYRILDVNPAFCAHTGLRAEAVIGQLATAAYGTAEAPYLATYAETVVEQQARSFETYFTPLERHFSISAFPLGGRQFATVFSDITERTRIEEQLRQAQKMEAVGRLAGGIAHDFNNLLMIMLAHGELAKESLPAESPARANIDNILGAAERASALTSQLLTFSRRQTVQSQVLDLNRVVAETGAMVRRILGEDVELEIIPGRDLQRVRADGGQLAQVLLNLVVNARDAMPRGGKLTIATASTRVGAPGSRGVEGLRPGRYVTLAVIDTGTGMSQEVQSHLFEPFFTTKPTGKGTGLGLTTVYGIVKQAGGEIRVSTRPGHGTTFRIYLPAADDVEAEGVERAADTLGGSESILLVEDDPEVRQIAVQLLTALGYRALAAESGQEALHLFRERSPVDLVVTDIVMPGMNGAELAEQIQALRPGTPVLFISGYADASSLTPGFSINAEDLLPKPFTAEALGRKIRQTLQRARAQLARPASYRNST